MLILILLQYIYEQLTTIKYSRCALLIKGISVIITIKIFEDPGRQSLVDIMVVLHRRERKLTFLFVFLCQASFCSNHYLRAHMNRSVEEANGANTYCLVRITHLSQVIIIWGSITILHIRKPKVREVKLFTTSKCQIWILNSGLDAFKVHIIAMLLFGLQVWREYSLVVNKRMSSEDTLD